LRIANLGERGKLHGNSITKPVQAVEF
jgi:hypothetical protein